MSGHNCVCVFMVNVAGDFTVVFKICQAYQG